MSSLRTFFMLLLFWAFCAAASGQAIQGEVIDLDSRKPLPDVEITNVHTSLTVSTARNGSFMIPATHDHLLVFKKIGYETVRVRLPKGYIPSYFKIILKHGFSVPEGLANDGRYDYHDDSLRFYNLYKHELEFEKLSTIQSIAHPFSALSKRNREIWRFQDAYAAYEKEKIVDRTFNERIINRYTGLTGDSLNVYIMRYRPSYDQIRSMSDYVFYLYIKQTVATYRKGYVTPRSSQ